MFTPPKVALIIVATLALALIADTIQADDPAFRSSKHGWSTEVACERTGMTPDQRMCIVMTRGYSVRNPRHGAASLMYVCTTGGEELLFLSFWTTESVDANDPALPVQWDKQPKEMVETWVRKAKERGKRRYYFNVVEIDEFIKNLAEHRTLTVDLPYRHVRERAKFSLANATSSIENAVHACGYLVRSHLGVSE